VGAKRWWAFALLSVVGSSSTSAQIDVAAARKACQAGRAKECNDLGVIYEAGLGVPSDKPAGVEFFRKACGGGDALGCTNLGHAYAEGVGVAKRTPSGGSSSIGRLATPARASDARTSDRCSSGVRALNRTVHRR
jgi:TPR repeat protein